MTMVLNRKIGSLTGPRKLLHYSDETVPCIQIRQCVRMLLWMQQTVRNKVILTRRFHLDIKNFSSAVSLIQKFKLIFILQPYKRIGCFSFTLRDVPDSWRPSCKEELPECIYELTFFFFWPFFASCLIFLLCFSPAAVFFLIFVFL